MANSANAPLRVIHRHRIGRRAFTRVSTLTYMGGQALAVLVWLHKDGNPMPGVCVELDKAKLRAGATRRIFVYDGETTDPRSEPFRPA